MSVPYVNDTQCGNVCIPYANQLIKTLVFVRKHLIIHYSTHFFKNNKQGMSNKLVMALVHGLKRKVRTRSPSQLVLYFPFKHACTSAVTYIQAVKAKMQSTV